MVFKQHTRHVRPNVILKPSVADGMVSINKVLTAEEPVLWCFGT